MKSRARSKCILKSPLKAPLLTQEASPMQTAGLLGRETMSTNTDTQPISPFGDNMN